MYKDWLHNKTFHVILLLSETICPRFAVCEEKMQIPILFFGGAENRSPACIWCEFR